MPTDALQVLKTLMKEYQQSTLAYLPNVLPVLLQKLVTSKNSALISRLLAVCARLMLTNADQFIEYLSAIVIEGKLINPTCLAMH